MEGSVYVVTLPAFQRCLEDEPDAVERRHGSGFPTGRGTGDGHLKAHHDLQATPTRLGKGTRLGVRGSIVPAAFQTSYSSFLKAGGRDLFSATEKEELI
ncbi:Chaperone protein DnaJ 1 [Bienertia sinuspersici]